VRQVRKQFYLFDQRLAADALLHPCLIELVIRPGIVLWAHPDDDR